jgi:hypothetical protein
MANSSVLGIDLSSRALDLVLVDEHDAGAHWDRLPLPQCDTKVELARAVKDATPWPRWFENHGVYLVAIESPMGQNRQAIAALYTVLGALVARLPYELPTWLLRPSEWKLGIGLPGNLATSKKGSERLKAWALEHHGEADWPTDAYVALAVAYVAREMNAKALVAA